MKKSSVFLISILLFLTIESCSIFGVHFTVHNPNHPGKTPKFSKERILLGELTHYRSCFDVKYYDLSVNIDPSNKSLNGTVEIHAIAVENFDTLQIDLHQNFRITQLVDRGSNEVLSYHRKERAIFVHTPRKKGEKFTLVISYDGKPLVAKKPPWKGGFVWEKDKEGNHWDGVACESIGASIWWPLKDHTNDEPDSMRLHYTVPNNLMAIGNGQFEGKVENQSSVTYNWFISYPINTYNVTVYVGKFKSIEDEYVGINGKILTLNHFVLEKNYEKAKLHFLQVKDQIKLYEKRFGEYPWYNDGFKLVESPYAGMEHQSAIAYGNGYKNDADSTTDHIILHETAHEWWGNCVSATDLAHVWLHEGFATYAEALFFEEKDGIKAYRRHLYFYRLFIKNKYPVVVEEGRRWFHFRQNGDVYMKGAWILHSLRIQINNDKVFFDILKTFMERNKYKVVDSHNFIELVNEKTKKDYNWFFNHYLYNNESPSLAYTVSIDGVLFYKWVNTSPEFNRLKLKLRSKNKAIIITPSNKVQKLSLPKKENGGWNLLFLEDVLFALEKDKSLISEYKRAKRKKSNKKVHIPSQ